MVFWLQRVSVSYDDCVVTVHNHWRYGCWHLIVTIRYMVVFVYSISDDESTLSQPTYPYIVQNMGATQHRHTLIMCQIHRYTQLLYCSFVRHLFIVIQVVLVIKHWCQNDLYIINTNYHLTKARLVKMSDCHSLEAELIKMKTATCNTYLW